MEADANPIGLYLVPQLISDGNKHQTHSTIRN